jgi:hypothetical protein
MASVLKAKRKADHEETDGQTKRARNKQRVLMLSSRGITYRMRHLMNDLEALLPHIKKGESDPRLEARLEITPPPSPRTRGSPQLQQRALL